MPFLTRWLADIYYRDALGKGGNDHVSEDVVSDVKLTLSTEAWGDFDLGDIVCSNVVKEQVKGREADYISAVTATTPVWFCRVHDKLTA